MTIDLTKLKALELPTKEIDIEVLGDAQKVKIMAMSDEISLNIRDIRDSGEISEVKVRQHLLKSCANFSDEEARLLCQKDGAAVALIISAILDLTEKFDKERARIRKEAKKKHKPESLTDTQS